MSKLALQELQQEEHQAHNTRAAFYSKLSEILGKPVLSYYTSFNQPVMIDNSDATMIESILQKMDLSSGLIMMINSPGGEGLAAERIINICRSYCSGKGYDVVIPKQAKSAATMICFGANQILMSPTSELGPIDPQLTLVEDGKIKRFSVCNIVDSYKDLFRRAEATKGNLDPFVQQLQRYDEREIKEFEDAIELAKDIAVLSLKTGMLAGCSKTRIAAKIGTFLTPQEKRSHGRPIYYQEAQKCGLKVRQLGLDDKAWQLTTELNVRLENYVTKHAAKCVETAEFSFSQPPIRRKES